MVVPLKRLPYIFTRGVYHEMVVTTVLDLVKLLYLYLYLYIDWRGVPWGQAIVFTISLYIYLDWRGVPWGGGGRGEQLARPVLAPLHRFRPGEAGGRGVPTDGQREAGQSHPSYWQVNNLEYVQPTTILTVIISICPLR